MKSADERFVIVFNGEIFNFVELKTELRANGYEFFTESDTEVVLAAWRHWGVESLNRFNGMWAFAIYDSAYDVLTLSRDRFGIKPLAYYRDNDLLVFASEAQAIQKIIPERVSPNWDYLERILKYDVSVYSGEATHFNEIDSVKPGFIATVKNGEIRHDQWYQMERVEVPAAYPEQVEHFRALFEDACRIRLRSDVPVGTCLSGGIDSGSIVAILSQLGGPESGRFCNFSHKAFTAGFPGSSNDESEAARLLAKKTGMALNVKTMTPPNRDELEEALGACDGPMPALSFFPIWKLYAHIKSQGISVTLDGQGADEMLGGYYLGYPAIRGAMQMNDRAFVQDICETYSALHENAPGWVANAYREARRDRSLEIKQKAKQPIKGALAWLGLYRMRPDKVRRPPEPPIWIGESLKNYRDWLHVALWQQFFFSPLPFLLHQYDRCSMANGVECRMPFMDYRLVEYIYSLPIRSRIGKGYTKRILRDSLQGVLPDSIRENKVKTGFNAPYQDWQNQGLRTWILDVMDTEEYRSLPGIDGMRLRHAVENRDPTDGHERKIWSKIHIAHWLGALRKSRTKPLLA